MNKKILIGLCSLLLVGLVACNKPQTPTQPSEEQQSSQVEQSSEDPISSEEPESSDDPISSEGPESSDDPISSEDPIVPEPEDVTLYYYNSLGWSAVTAYAWDANGTTLLGGWPGTPIDPVEGEDNWYSVTLPIELATGSSIIFNNGASSNALQTPDISINLEKVYHSASNGEGYATKEEAIEAGMEKWYLKGTHINNWQADPNYVLTINPDNPDEYCILGVELVAGEEFKINDGGSRWYGINQCKGDSNVIQGSDNIKIKAAGTYNIYFNTKEAASNAKCIWIGLAE